MDIKSANKRFNDIINWGTSTHKSDVENRSIRFSNVVFIIILCLQSYAFFNEASNYLEPGTLVWDQWSIPLMIVYSLVSLQLNRKNLTLFTRILLLIAWPSITYVIPIILQQTPSDYYLGYPIALIFHGFLIQISLPYRKYKGLTISLMVINFLMILTFPDFLIANDDEPQTLISMTGNQFYFYNGFTFWVALNLILAYLLKSLNDRIEEIKKQKDLIASKKEELEVAMEILNERQKQLVHSEKMASLVKLSAGLAHQVNNPLNYIMGSRDLLKKHYQEIDDNEDVVDIFAMMTSGITRIQEIVKNLNLLTNSSKSEGYVETINVHELVQNTVLGIRSGKTEHIIIRNLIDNELAIEQNPVLITQVLYQLLNNAVDAMEGNPGEIIIRFAVREKIGTFEIVDSGKGISQEIISSISEPFYTTKAPGEGTGLGLFIANSIVNELNGKMEIHSELGSGTQVKFSLIIP